MSLSNTSTSIKKRDLSNDVFITPLGLAKLQIDSIKHYKKEIWFDPFKNSGSYYNQFPTEDKEWTEILLGRDFFKFNGKVDIICSNPPYSMIDKILEKSAKLKPRVISYLIGINNLTAKRMEMMEQHGYYITYFHVTKVWRWFGMSVIVNWETRTANKSIINFDRTVWRENVKGIEKGLEEEEDNKRVIVEQEQVFYPCGS